MTRACFDRREAPTHDGVNSVTTHRTSTIAPIAPRARPPDPLPRKERVRRVFPLAPVLLKLI